MRKKILISSILAGTLVAMSGCGSSSTSSAAVSTGTAFYVDSAVKGVTVTCGTTVSTTDANGMFRYEEGQVCQFKLGNVLLRTEGNMYQDRVVIEDNVRTAQYLQSMDYDGDPRNGIDIHEQTDDVMEQHGIAEVPGTDQDLAEAVDAMQNAGIGYQGDMVYEQEAREHVDETKREHEGTDTQDDGHQDQPGVDDPNDDHQDQPGVEDPNDDHNDDSNDDDQNDDQNDDSSHT